MFVVIKEKDQFKVVETDEVRFHHDMMKITPKDSHEELILESYEIKLISDIYPEQHQYIAL